MKALGRSLGAVLLEQRVKRKLRRSGGTLVANSCARYLEEMVRSTDLPRPLGITLGERRDGIGAQIHAQMSLIAFCRHYAVPYVHRDIMQAEHISDEREVARWNRFFNLSSFTSGTFTHTHPALPIETFLADPCKWREPQVLSATDLHGLIDLHPARFKNSFTEMAKRLKGQAKPESGKGTVEIALHIRRGDVSAARNSKRFTDNTSLESCLSSILQIVESVGLKPTVSLYSQGDRQDFEGFTGLGNVTLHLDTDPLEVMQKLIHSDILIMAKSSFSMVAALLSKGIVLCPQFWHAPLPHWLQLDPEGQLSREMAQRLIVQLAALKTEKPPERVL